MLTAALLNSEKYSFVSILAEGLFQNLSEAKNFALSNMVSCSNTYVYAAEYAPAYYQVSWIQFYIIFCFLFFVF